MATKSKTTKATKAAKSETPVTVPGQTAIEVIKSKAKDSLKDATKAMERLDAHDIGGALRILIQGDMDRANEVIASLEDIAE